MTITVEICVDTPDGLAAALAAGADRIELCAALALGGLTPSPGLISLAAGLAIPVYAMVRPREGDFLATPAEIDQMRRDIDAVRAAGLAGVVFGVSDVGGRLDTEALGRLVAHAEGLGTTLHRAFDLAPDPFEALETAIALGFERVLTSGGALRVEDALPRVAALTAQAAGRIAVMPGGGVTAENAETILKKTGAAEIHASCRQARLDIAPAAVALGFAASPTRPATSEGGVRALVEAVRAGLAGSWRDDWGAHIG